MTPCFDVVDITTYPIKGFAGQSHQDISVAANSLLPGDRAFALTSGTAASESAPHDQWLKKAHFLQLMKWEGLASLSLQFDANTSRLALLNETGLLYEGHLDDEADAERLAKFIHHKLGIDQNAPLARLFHMKEGGFTDTKAPLIAFGNEASIADFADKMGHPADARRYRLNVIMKGAPAFAELQLLGKQARLGSAVFEFLEPVGRCAAIEVNPDTAQREAGLVQKMHHAYGAADMGVFAKVIEAGQFSIGDQLQLI